MKIKKCISMYNRDRFIKGQEEPLDCFILLNCKYEFLPTLKFLHFIHIIVHMKILYIHICFFNEWNRAILK